MNPEGPARDGMAMSGRSSEDGQAAVDRSRSDVWREDETCVCSCPSWRKQAGEPAMKKRLARTRRSASTPVARGSTTPRRSRRVITCKSPTRIGHVPRRRARRQQIRQHRCAQAVPRRPSPKHKTPKIQVSWWGLVFRVMLWNLDQWAGPDLNRRPPHFQCGALPTELPTRGDTTLGHRHCGSSP